MPIRLLLTHPYGWPHVRRGAEREVHELAGRLVRAGVDARVLTGSPKALTSRARVLGAPVRYVRVPRRAGWPEPGPGFGAAALAGSLTASLVHCFHYVDAWGATRGPRPVVLKLTGTVRPERVTGLDERLLRGALARADEVWVNSAWAAAETEGFGVPTRVVPAGLDTTAFAPRGARSDAPLVVCAAAGDEPRKRVVDLLAAWPAVRAALPGASLVLAGSAPPAALPDGVTHVGALGTAELAALYARAWVVVAPAVYEALGLVTLEALACGTPVVGADSGATSALLGPLGTLCAPLDPASLADAVVAAAPLAHDPAFVARCREVALPYDWDRVVPLVREGYARVLR